MAAELLSGLDKTPSRSAAFIWTDYIELRCLIHPDRYFSIDGAEEALHEADDYLADAEEPNMTSGSENLDKLEKRWAECERTINRRAELLGDSYPFTPAVGYRGIEVASSNDNLQRQWYRFLLLASSLQYVPNHNALTSAFEKASFSIFEKLIPPGSEVHGFWPGAHHYPDEKPKRLTKLAEDLRGSPLFNEHSFKPHDRGDAGIDLVAWHPIGDLRNRIPIALAQCGCSVEEWKTKPVSTGRDKLNNLIHLSTTDWWRYYFMPLDLYGPTGLWSEGSDGDLPAVIVIDRMRFINMINMHDIPLPNEAKAFVTQLAKENYR